MKFGFIFVLFKTPESEINRLKKEIKELKIQDYRLYFIDNTDNNIGYAGGVNQGIKKAIRDGCELIVVANPDISLAALTFLDFVQAAKRFDISGFAMNQEGKTYYGGELDKWRMSGGLSEKKPRTKFSKVDFVSGSLMMIDKAVVDKIGLFDESYFLYYEEVDYCYRARKAGFRVGIDSSKIYQHFEVSKDNPAKNYYLFKNRLKFLIKYGSSKQKLRELLRLPKTIYEEIIKRPFYLSFFSLNISSLVNKILHFVLFLVLIRSFPPQEYAVYTLAWTHVGLFLPLLDFGTTSYGLVYLPGQKKDSSINLFSFRIVLSLLTLLLTLLFAFIFRYPPAILTAIILTSVVILANTFSGSFLIFSSIIEKSYLVSLVSMIFQITLVITLIGTVFFSGRMFYIFVATFILYSFYAIFNFFLIKKQIKGLGFKFSPSAWLAIAKKSMVFLMISLIAGFYSKADVLLLNFMKGAKEVGIYSSGYKFLDALMFMVTAYNVSSMPMFAKFAKEKRKNLFVSKIKKDFVLVLLAGGLTALGIFVFSPLVLPLVMKEDYHSGIPVLRIIIFALPMILLTSIALNGLYALKRAKWVICLFLFQLVYNPLMNIILIPRYSYFASSWITLVGESINVIISFIILKKAINENFR